MGQGRQCGAEHRYGVWPLWSPGVRIPSRERPGTERQPANCREPTETGIAPPARQGLGGSAGVGPGPPCPRTAGHCRPSVALGSDARESAGQCCRGVKHKSPRQPREILNCRCRPARPRHRRRCSMITNQYQDLHVIAGGDRADSGRPTDDGASPRTLADAGPAGAVGRKLTWSVLSLRDLYEAIRLNVADQPRQEADRIERRRLSDERDRELRVAAADRAGRDRYRNAWKNT